MNVSLIMLKQDGTKRGFPVRNKATILGRGAECDLCIPLHIISRRHCQLCQVGDILKVRDLHSSNGTYVNGHKVEDETQVQAGDSLQIGPLTFVIQIDGQPAEIAIPDSGIMQPMPDISEASQDAMNRSGTFIG